MSLEHSLDPQLHLEAGKALALLRDEGVLINGSGMRLHNMRGIGDPCFAPLSAEFDDWLTSLCHPPRASAFTMTKSCGTPSRCSVSDE